MHRITCQQSTGRRSFFSNCPIWILMEKCEGAQRHHPHGFHAHHRVVKSNKHFVTPSSRVAHCGAQSLLSAVASQAESSGWDCNFEPTASKSEHVVTAEHPSTARIGAANAPRMPATQNSLKLSAGSSSWSGRVRKEECCSLSLWQHLK